MIDFLIEGGPLFTFPMTLIFLVNIALAIRNFVFINSDRFESSASANQSINTIKYLGIIVLTIGILGQIIGLYTAFQVISQGNMEITPAILAGGIKISSITTILGLVYYIISYAAFMFLSLKVKIAD